MLRCLFIFNLFFYYSTHAQINLNAGLVAYLPFNGNTLDMSGNGNHATNFGAALATDQWGNLNSAYNFNGFSNWMEIVNAPTLQMSSITLCARVKPNAFYSGLCYNNSIIDRGNGGLNPGSFSLIYTPSLNQNPATYCFIPDSLHESYRINVHNSAPASLSCITPINAPPYVATNQWDCVLGVFNDTTQIASIYVNGVFRYSFNYASGIGGVNNSTLFIGGTTNPTYPYYVNGILDEIRIYNRALTTQEIDSVCNLSGATPNLTILPSDTNVCYGQQVTLTANNASTYNWSGGVVNGVPFTPLATSTYTVTGTSISGATSTASITITVNPLPSITTSVNPTSICSGDSVIFSVSGATSYVWSGGVSENIPFYPSASTTYTVTGTDVNGCTNTNTVSVTVFPVPTIIAFASPPIVCKNKPTTLFALGASSLQWSGGMQSGIAFTPSSTTTYTVTGTDANGCTNTSTVEVQVVENLPISISNPFPILCLGDTTTLTAAGANTYNWTPVNGLSDATSATTLAYPTAPIVYTVIGTDAMGCTGSATVFIDIKINPSITLSKSNDIECNLTTTTLTASGADTYSWSPSSFLSSPFSNSTVASMIENTTFTVIATLGSCIIIDTISVNVFKNEESTISIPNAFSPNQDGKNDCFRILHQANFKEFYWAIYNRYGERVFETDNPHDCWNGEYKNKAAPINSYYYFMKGKTACGVIFRKGDITLVR